MNRTVAFGLTFIAVAYAIVGTIDYRVERAIAAERKATAVAARPAPAPTWSKRCERRQLDTVVTKADNAKEVIHCVARRVLTVSAQ